MESSGELVVYDDDSTPMSPAFAYRVSADELVKNRDATTASSLHELANYIRRNPSSVRNASGFQGTLRKWRVRELLLRAAWTLIVCGALYSLHQYVLASNDDAVRERNRNTAPDRLERQLPRALCGTADALNESLLAKLVASQPGHVVLLAVAVTAFLGWIVSMHLEARQIATKITLLQQTIWPLVDLATRALVVFLVSTGVVTLLASTVSVEGCVEHAKDFVKLALAHPLSGFWHGSVLVVTEILVMLTGDENGMNSLAHETQQFEFVAFLAFVVHLFVLREAFSLLVAARSFALADVLPALFLSVAVAVPVPEGMSRTEHGLVLLTAIAIANLIRHVLLMLRKPRAPRSVPDADEPLFEPDPEDEDDEPKALTAAAEEVSQ